MGMEETTAEKCVLYPRTQRIRLCIGRMATMGLQNQPRCPQRMQNKALRFITGQYVNTNCDILRAEADIPSYSFHSDQLIVKSRETWLNGRRSSSSSDNRRPTNIKTIMQRGRVHTNSYEEEVAAATMASSYALTANPSAQRCITFQWIPGHAAIPGNELTDATAKAATILDEPQALAS